jgi:hypothetical protein
MTNVFVAAHEALRLRRGEFVIVRIILSDASECCFTIFKFDIVQEFRRKYQQRSYGP